MKLDRKIPFNPLAIIQSKDLMFLAKLLQYIKNKSFKMLRNSMKLVQLDEKTKTYKHTNIKSKTKRIITFCIQSHH